MRSAKPDTARCSFCHKTEDAVDFLIPSPSDLNVRICDECLAVCNSILSDVDYPPGPPAGTDDRGHCRFCDPRTPTLLNTIERWVIAESQHRHSLVFLARACRLALSMMGLDAA
jgi:ATP-dependent Clp protease ATP-binding subunit ClpX